MPTMTTPQEIAAAIESALEGGGHLVIRFGHSQMRQLKAEEVELLVASLKAKDAERYRYLRDKASPSDVETWWWGYMGGADPVPPETFDKIIDAAMLEESNAAGHDEGEKK